MTHNRKEESKQILDKYPTRVPVIVETKDINLDKHKYLVPKRLTVGEFMQLIRKKTENLQPTEAIFFLVNNKMPMIGTTLGELYEEDKSECGFLFINVAKENTFG